MSESKPPRESIPWYPTVADDKCDACGECIKFCSYGVYTASESGKALVTNPYGCMVGCSYCSTNVCKRGAIAFPTLDWLKEFLDNYKKTASA